MSNFPDNFRADHPASPYSTAAEPDGDTPTEHFAAAALRLESLCGLLNELWDQRSDIAGGCGGDELVAEVAATLEAALAPLRSRIDSFIVNCEINTRIDDDRSNAVFERGIAALNAIIQQGRAA
jgi:hypothetical protein